MKMKILAFFTFSVTILPGALSLGRFSYDEEDKLGPKNWDDVKDSKNNFWKQWKELSTKKNKCGHKKNYFESPIDLHKNAPCDSDHHKYISKRDKRICRLGVVDFKIEPWGLEATYPNSPKECNLPTMDISNLFKKRYATKLYMKVPGEHRINGDSFHAELVVYHADNTDPNHKEHRDNRLVASSVLFDTSQDKHSDWLEDLLLNWESTAENKKNLCYGAKKLQNSTNTITKTVNLQNSTSTITKTVNNLRSLQTKGDKWYLHKPWRNEYYYSYKGSLTIPPCSDIVYWFIRDNALSMSKKQLQRVQDLITGYLDKDCKKGTYADKNGNVARPIQKYDKHSVFHCDKSDY
mmetsp:Transcript_20478/g.46487  ORF Transcript_20478/g.46487 Transcript_20478/m.46487 type:complete len:350 (-) Transcript_20478:107-1156(-)